MRKQLPHYDPVSMLFHWSVALLILGTSLSSFFLSNPFQDSATIMTRAFHNVAGTLALGLAHNVLGKLLLAIALLHSVHALWHHFGRRDELVRRMLPWTSK
jgi:cytochrome b561